MTKDKNAIGITGQVDAGVRYTKGEKNENSQVSI